jgi:hypothetical protein
VGRGAHISGHLVYCMVYEFKEQPGMFKIKLIDPVGGGVYELKISASSIGKEAGVKKKPVKWSAEQKRDIMIGYLRGKTTAVQIPPRAGRPELEEVVNDKGDQMMTRWVAAAHTWNRLAK